MRCQLNLALTTILLAGASGASAMRCELAPESTRSRAPVIELYTSEGCSSCPPADRWLARMDEARGFVALAFHVDYWDRLGWTDRFADAQFSRRQSWRARLARSNTVFTPQVVVDGRTRTDWSRADVLADIPNAAPFALSVRAVVETMITVDWQVEPGDAPVDDAVVTLAITESGLSSTPDRGENRAAVLRHAHVVRAYLSNLALSTGSARLPLPVDLQLTNARLNIIVEDPRSGVPWHAVVLSLAPCSPVQSARTAPEAF